MKKFITENNTNLFKIFHIYFSWKLQRFGEYELTGDLKKKDDLLFIGHLLDDAIGNLFQNTSFFDSQNNELIAKNI